MPPMSSFAYEPMAPEHNPPPNVQIHDSDASGVSAAKTLNGHGGDETKAMADFVGYDSMYMPSFMKPNKVVAGEQHQQVPVDLATLASLGLQHQQVPPQPNKQDTMNDMLSATLKKYKVKNYLLTKILGTSHEIEEDEGGFFSNKHLKRHGTAGVAAKVLGELIGIKIRETIEKFGKSFSEIAKEFTTRNFVSMGNVFARFGRFQKR